MQFKDQFDAIRGQSEVNVSQFNVFRGQSEVNVDQKKSHAVKPEGHFDAIQGRSDAIFVARLTLNKM